MILNENYVLKKAEAETFRFTPQKKKLAKGTRLCRFVTLGESYIVGSFWTDLMTYNRMKHFAKQSGASVATVARAWSAIKYEWNTKMHYVCEIRLKKDCYAWEGPAKYQSTTQKSNVLWMGNGNQIFLPNLTDTHAAIAGLYSV